MGLYCIQIAIICETLHEIQFKFSYPFLRLHRLLPAMANAG